jgi:hypothetical protein
MVCAFGRSNHAQAAGHHVVAARSPHQIAAQSQEPRRIRRRPGTVNTQATVIDDANDQQRETHLTGAEKSSTHSLYDRAANGQFADAN